MAPKPNTKKNTTSSPKQEPSASQEVKFDDLDEAPTMNSTRAVEAPVAEAMMEPGQVAMAMEDDEDALEMAAENRKVTGDPLEDALNELDQLEHRRGIIESAIHEKIETICQLSTPFNKGDVLIDDISRRGMLIGWKYYGPDNIHFKLHQVKRNGHLAFGVDQNTGAKVPIVIEGIPDEGWRVFK